MGDNARGNGARDHSNIVELARHALEFAYPPNLKAQLVSSYAIIQVKLVSSYEIL